MTAEAKKILDGIYGNTAQKEFFISETEKGKLAHAYIFEGAKGSGKYSMALCLSALIAGDERACRMIMQGQATDITVIDTEEGRKTIGVEAVRRIRAGAFIKPGDFEFKAYIIRNSDKMTVQAQNALLKLLEEPPSGVYFFLLCENSSVLLPTVRSRASVIRMQTFGREELSRYLVSVSEKAAAMKQNDPEGFDSLLRSSGGTIGGALSALGSREIAESDLKLTVLSLIEDLDSRNRTGFYLKMNALPQDREALSECIETLILALRDTALLKYDREGELFFGYADRLKVFARKFTSGRINSYYEALDRARADLASNFNVQSVKNILCAALLSARF